MKPVCVGCVYAHANLYIGPLRRDLHGHTYSIYDDPCILLHMFMWIWTNLFSVLLVVVKVITLLLYAFECHTVLFLCVKCDPSMDVCVHIYLLSVGKCRWKTELVFVFLSVLCLFFCWLSHEIDFDFRTKLTSHLRNR